MLRFPFLCLTGTLFVASHGVSAAISECLEHENDTLRLACYDLEAGYFDELKKDLLGSEEEEAEVEEVASKGDWIVQSSVSKLDDSTNVIVRLRSHDESNCRYDTESHYITLACRENETNLWVTFGGCYMADIQGKGRVTYRLGSSDVQTKNFTESTDNMALGLWSGGSAIPFIKRMMEHDTMIVRATPFSDNPVTGEYNIAGLEEAIKPLREACHW